MAVDPIVVVAELYKEKYNLSSDEFIALNAKYFILDFIYDRCEMFCKTGSESILDDIHEHINRQKNAERKNYE